MRLARSQVVRGSGRDDAFDGSVCIPRFEVVMTTGHRVIWPGAASAKAAVWRPSAVWLRYEEKI
jgi:hypothetical protein